MKYFYKYNDFISEGILIDTKKKLKLILELKQIIIFMKDYQEETTNQIKMVI